MTTNTLTPVTLHAATAADVMTRNPISLRHNAIFPEMLQFFMERNVTAAPVINEAGRAIGVVSVTDLLVHLHECGCPEGANMAEAMMGPATAAELMTPSVFCVAEHTPALDVVRDLLQSNVHHLFVADESGTVIGVISTRDVLRLLR